jgi:predicted GNAT family acetyltransferase
MAITVQDNAAKQRYELWDGHLLIGLAAYRKEGNQIAFTHTEIAEDYGGQGLATQLIKAALDDSARHGLLVLPYCPFVAGFIRKHPDYAPLVPAARRGAFGLTSPVAPHSHGAPAARPGAPGSAPGSAARSAPRPPGSARRAWRCRPRG